MIPQEKSAAVNLGLREAFGVSEWEDIREVASGAGANPVFRIVVRGSAFLLRINSRAGDLTRHYTCMKAAAEAGLAPRVWYASAEDRVSITDFVEVAPFPVTEGLVRIPAALRTLHALPPFAGAPDHLNTTCMFLMKKGPAVDGFVEKFRAANLFPEGEREELLAAHAQLAEVYARLEPDMVSSHNDLFKPDNMLFDGHRLWLVDWEAAFLNDRYTDLAVAANQVVTDDAEEGVYLEKYFGQPPEAYQRARFFLTQQIAHLFYAMVFLWMGSAGRQVDLRENAPDYRDFHRRFWAGEVELKGNETKIAYGRVHRERLLQNLRQGRFQEAVRIVSDRYACP